MVAGQGTCVEIPKGPRMKRADIIMIALLALSAGLALLGAPRWLAAGALGLAALLAMFRAADILRVRRMASRPRITADEVKSVQAALAADTRPARRLTLAEGAAAPTASRIGGAPWAPDPAAAWPDGSDGRPLVFLGQLNFAELPALPGFPASGLLQIFTGAGPAAHLVWHAAPRGGGVLPLPQMFLGKPGRGWHPFRGSALTQGLAIASAEVQTDAANDDLHPHCRQVADWFERLPADPQVAALLREHETRMEAIRAGYGAHRIGGHPGFVQFDPRAEVDAYRDRGLDRVILHLGWEPALIESGDGGEINILIPVADLRARRWDRAVWYEDCA